MTYKINGTTITLQPTSGQWRVREALGISGDGHAIYPGVFEFELKWDLISASDIDQLHNFFDAMGLTGTVVADLPQRGASSYTFFSYSGCVLRDLEMGEYFEEHVQQATLIIANIRA